MPTVANSKRSAKIGLLKAKIGSKAFFLLGSTLFSTMVTKIQSMLILCPDYLSSTQPQFNSTDSLRYGELFKKAREKDTLWSEPCLKHSKNSGLFWHF